MTNVKPTTVFNAITGRPYTSKGVTALLEAGFSSGRFVTLKQAQKAGGFYTNAEIPSSRRDHYDYKGSSGVPRPSGVRSTELDKGIPLSYTLIFENAKTGKKGRVKRTTTLYNLDDQCYVMGGWDKTKVKTVPNKEVDYTELLTGENDNDVEEVDPNVEGETAHSPSEETTQTSPTTAVVTTAADEIEEVEVVGEDTEVRMFIFTMKNGNTLVAKGVILNNDEASSATTAFRATWPEYKIFDVETWKIGE